MTSPEDRLRLLLQKAAPACAGVETDRVAARVRSRQKCRALAAATAVVLAGAGVVTALDRLSQAGGETRLSTPAAPISTGKVVTFNGAKFMLPTGWTVEQSHCGQPRQDTVALGRYEGSCPAEPAKPTTTSVVMYGLYDRASARGWSGESVTWQGQPAWLALQQLKGVSTATLSLPWSNAVIIAQAVDATEARNLLDQVMVEPAHELGVPEQAQAIDLQSLSSKDGDQEQGTVRVADAGDVRRLLGDLKSLPLVTSAEKACDGDWALSTVLVTAETSEGDRTFAVRSGRCQLVTGEQGIAAVPTARLLDDLRVLLAGGGLN